MRISSQRFVRIHNFYLHNLTIYLGAASEIARTIEKFEFLRRVTSLGGTKWTDGRTDGRSAMRITTSYCEGRIIHDSVGLLA